LSARIRAGDQGVIKAGVAGAGVFGGHHARKYAAIKGVQIAAVYDHDLHHAERLAKPLHAVGFDDYAAFLRAVDVVTIATPADAHAGLAVQALAAGRHVYVEKPLATTQAEADGLVAQAKANGVVLACGHQERVIFQAMGLLDLAAPISLVQAVRRGTPSERNRDVSCVLDLMIHDLDLAARLARSPLARVAAEGGFDEVRAAIQFENGVRARFEASRVAETRERTMRLDFEGGPVMVDFLAPSFDDRSGLGLNAGFAETPEGRDPLGASVAGFIAAVAGRAPRPIVTGEEGAEALAIALAIEAAAGL
jgi:predicted dehydrogenase